MWPAGIGGQYCFWDENLNTFIISESSRKFNAIIGSPFAKKISSPPAHQFSDMSYQSRIELPVILRNQNFITIAIARGKYQRDGGKITHEIPQSAGIIKWFEEYPFAFIHGDTSPYYLIAFWKYVKGTNDITFLEDSWDSLEKAFNWCVSTDEDGDGLMDNKKAGLGALEFGQMINIKTDIYLASVWVKALESFSKMAEILGDRDEKVKAITPWPSFPISFCLS